MLKNLVIMLGTILITNPTFVLASEENCGPPPTEPENICNNPLIIISDYRQDCLYRLELASFIYDWDKEQWNECKKRQNEYSSSSSLPPARWREKSIRVCTTLDTPIYGNNWFRGERAQTGTYNSGNEGWVCDEVFVPETINQYYDYQDYDGSLCTVFLDQEIRIEPRTKCETIIVRELY